MVLGIEVGLGADWETEPGHGADDVDEEGGAEFQAENEVQVCTAVW